MESPSRLGTLVPWFLGAILVIGLATAAWVGVRGALAYSELQDAKAALSKAAQSAGNAEKTAALILEASESLQSARELTSDPIWRAAENLPWIGVQLEAFDQVTAAGNDVSRTALEPMAAIASTVTFAVLRPVDGALDLSVLGVAQRAAVEAASGLESAAHRLESINQVSLLRPLGASIDELATQIAAASTTARAASLLPGMLGGEQPRTWLLLFQNTAELRSLGGMPGATAVITATDGHLTLSSQGDAVMPRFDQPVIDLGSELRGIYGDRPSVWFSGTTILPDFAEAAPMAREMWRRAHGVDADGVISLDPFALSYILRATGPIVLPTGETLDSENAVDFLLNQVYLKYSDPDDQNAVFAGAAAAVFTALTDGAADPSALIPALAQAAQERRLLLWSSVGAEQALFDKTDLSGGLPETDADAARFGVYFNDGTGSKLGYYLDTDAAVGWEACTSSGHPADDLVNLTVNLRNSAPADAATSLPPSIVGGNYGVEAATLRVVTYIYLPRGAMLETADGEPSDAFGGGVDGDYRVLSHQVDLKPGESSKISVTAKLVEPMTSTVAADLTPGFGQIKVSSTCAADETHHSR